MSGPVDRPLSEEEARREADLELAKPIAAYDPRPFSPEQEARIAEIVARAAEQAVSDMMRKSQRRL